MSRADKHTIAYSKRRWRHSCPVRRRNVPSWI